MFGPTNGGRSRSLAEYWEEAEQLALLAALHDGEVDNARLRSLTGQHPADATKVLRSLRDRDFLAMTGWGRGASYRLGVKARVDVIGALRQEIPYQARIDMGHLGANIGDLEASIEDSGQDIEDSENARSSIEIRLREIAAPTRTRAYLSANKRDEIVVQLCSITPLTIQELADLTGRGRDHMKSVVRTLVKTDQLSFLYPDRPRARGQRYVAIPK